MSLIPKIKISNETAGPIVNAALEVFSPATELLGWMGDAIRIHRARTVLRCFEKTKKIAKKAGLKLKAPPVKFLSQFIENCSLEDEKDETLIEWWSRLLVVAGTDYHSKQVFYSNVLKQITAIELELLEALVRNGGGSYKLEHAREAEFVSDFSFAHTGLVLASDFTRKAIKKSIKDIRTALEIPGVILLDVFVDDSDSRQWQEYHPDYTDDELANWQVLQSLQLVRLDYQRFVSGSVEYRVRSVKITQLGAEFYFSCHDAHFDQKISVKVRFKRKRRVSPNIRSNRKRKSSPKSN
jgi:hypothetical protein